jgi:cyclase
MTSTLTDHGPLAPPRLEDLGGGLFAYVQPDGSWMINNTGFLVGRDGVACVDGCSTQRRTRAFLAAVAGVTDQPVRTLVNTHSHPDHTGGNSMFRPAAIVAHEGTREDMIAFTLPKGGGGLFEPFEVGDVEPDPPFLTFADSMTLWVDDLRCEIRHVGTPAHTTSDSIVWVPERGVLYAGDLVFNGATPFCVSGSVAGSIEVLTSLIAPLGATTIVPGHGDLCGPEAIEPLVGYLRFVERVAASALAAGVTPLEAARETDLGPYAGWTDPERLVGNLNRSMAEQDGRPWGGPEIFAAFADMITYNDGRPLSCRA